MPTPTPAPTPQDATDGRPDAASIFVVDRSADKYKLVFPTAYEGKLSFVRHEERAALERTRHASLNNFIEHLNKAGEQGYKLMSVVGWAPVAIVKLDKVQYEYAWFETINNRFYALSGFEGGYAQLSKRGLRLADHSLLSLYCEAVDPDNSAYGEACEARHLFLLERPKGFEEPSQHRLATGLPGLRAKPNVEMSTRIGERLTDGFYPTRALSKFEVLLEQATKDDEPSADRPEVRVVTSAWWRDDLKDKVNGLAKQGYRLALVNNGIAVMYRPVKDATPATYVWLNAKDKGFGKQLAKLQEGGAVYRMTYPDSDGDEDRLIFEQGAVAYGRRREYRVLKFELQSVENAAENRVSVDLAPQSKEIMKTVNELTKEGFEVRDLFVSDSDKFNVLLERAL